MTFKIGSFNISNANSDFDGKSVFEKTNQKLPANRESQNQNALGYLSNSLVNNDEPKPEITPQALLEEVLCKQPLNKPKKEKRVDLEVKYPKPPEEMTVEDYKTALIRAEYNQADLGMLTDEEIQMSEAALVAKGLTVKYYGFNLESLQNDQRSGKRLFTTDYMIERARRGGQAVLQYQEYKANQADALKAKAENETNQMFADQGRVLWNSGVNIVEGTINTAIDAALTEGGRNPLPLLNPTRPQVDFSGVKSDYRSEMMRRNLHGIVDGDGIKRGEFTELGVTIGAPFVVGAAITPKAAPQSLKTLGGIPEVEASAVNSATKAANEAKTAIAPKVNRTEPSLKPDKSRFPDGEPKTLSQKDIDPNNIRGTKGENESAKVLSESGFKVEQLSDKVKGKIQGVKKPDLTIEGKIFDAYTPNKTTSARSIWTTLKGKMVDPKTGVKQADRFVINMNKSDLTLEQMTKQFKDFPLQDLKEVIIIKDGKIIHFFPFKD
ncbi:MAG: hypothetical protein ACR2F2_10890 [Pyrinomonadaceae bacterium]